MEHSEGLNNSNLSPASQGYESLRAGDLLQAKQLFIQALASDENDLKALNCLGFVLYQLKEYEYGEAVCRKAISVSPGNAYAYKGLGLHCAKNGKVAEGVSFIHKALELSTDFVDAYYDLAVIHYEAGSFDKARESLELGLAYVKSKVHEEMFNRFLSTLDRQKER